MKNLTMYMRIILVVTLVTVFSFANAQNFDEAKKKFNSGIQAFQSEDYEAAVVAFEEVVKICADLVENYEDEDAEDLMYQTIEKIPSIYLNISKKALKEAKDVKKGIEYAEKAKTAAIDYEDDATLKGAQSVLANVYTKLGGMKLKKKELDAALKDLNTAISEDESYASAYLYMTLVYKEKAIHDSVKKFANLTIEKADKPTERKTKGTAKKLGHQYFKRIGNEAKSASKFKEAEKHLLSSLEFHASDNETIFLLFEVYLALNNFEKTVEYGNKAAEVASSTDIQSRIFYDLGKLYQAKGENDKACASFNKAQVGAYAENAKYEMDNVLKCK